MTGRTLTCPGDGNMEARFRGKKRELKLELKNQGSDVLDYISEGRKGQIAVLFSSEDTVQHQDASQRRSCVQINSSTGSGSEYKCSLRWCRGFPCLFAASNCV